MLRRLTAILLSAALLVIAPGLPCYQAAAQLMGQAGSAAAPVRVAPVTPALSSDSAGAGSLAFPETTLATENLAAAPALLAHPAALEGGSAPVLVSNAPTSLSALVPAQMAQTVQHGETLFIRQMTAEAPSLAPNASNGAPVPTRGENAAHASGELAPAESIRGALSAQAPNFHTSVSADPNGQRAYTLFSSFYTGSQGTTGEEGNPAPPVESGLGAPRAENSGLAPPGEGTPAAQTRAPEPPRPPRLRDLAKKAFIMASVFGIIEVVVTHVAPLWGHQFHSNYAMPGVKDLKDALAAGQTGTAAYWVAWLIGMGMIAGPIAEEVLFRGGLMSYLNYLLNVPARLLKSFKKDSRWVQGLQRAAAWVAKQGGFWIPALLAAAVFATLHETADWVVLSLYGGLTLLLSRAYAKDGILASMSLHIANNVLSTATVIITLLLGAHEDLIAFLVVLGTLPISILFALQLRARNAAAPASGPLRLSVGAARILAAILLAGIAVLSPTLVWFGNNVAMLGLPALGLLTYAAMMNRSARESKLGLPAAELPPGALYNPEGLKAASRGFLAFAGLILGFVAASFIPSYLAAGLLGAVVLLIGMNLSLLSGPSKSHPATRSWLDYLSWAFQAVGLGLIAYPLTTWGYLFGMQHNLWR